MTSGEAERRSAELFGATEALARRQAIALSVEGERVHLDFYDGGVAAAGAVVFVPGMGAHALLYGGFLDALSRRGRHVVGVDLRGHGRSARARGDFSVATALADLRAAVGFAAERFGAPVGLMGSSLGGTWALVGANAIEEVASAVSHGVVLPDTPATLRDRLLKPVALALAGVVPRAPVPTRLLTEWRSVADHPDVRAAFFADPLVVWRYLVGGAAGFYRYRPERPLTRLRCPHLVLVGERDRLTPAAVARRVFERLEGEKELVVLRGAGHLGGLVERREEVVDLVDAWFQRTLNASSAAIRPKTSAAARPLE